MASQANAATHGYASDELSGSDPGTADSTYMAPVSYVRIFVPLFENWNGSCYVSDSTSADNFIAALGQIRNADKVPLISMSFSGSPSIYQYACTVEAVVVWLDYTGGSANIPVESENEPDLSNTPASTAAYYYDWLQQANVAFGWDVSILAGPLSDQDNANYGYMDSYIAALRSYGYAPTWWAVHDYYDPANTTTLDWCSEQDTSGCAVTDYYNEVGRIKYDGDNPAVVFVTEGGWNSCTHNPWQDARAAYDQIALANGYNLPSGTPAPYAVFWYEYQAANPSYDPDYQDESECAIWNDTSHVYSPEDPYWDSGLVDVYGNKRKSYCTLVDGSVYTAMSDGRCTAGD